MSLIYTSESNTDTQTYIEPEQYDNQFPFLTRFALRQAEGRRIAEIRRLESADLLEAMMWVDPNLTALQSNVENCPLYPCDSFSASPIGLSLGFQAYKENEILMETIAENLDLDFEIPKEGNFI